MSIKSHSSIDICILCALSEEANQLKEAFQDASAKIFHDPLPVVFQRDYNTRLKRNYDHATITNIFGEQLNVVVTWPPDNGPLGTGLQLYPLLEEFQPRFAAMTGICAGDQEKVKLGDIIVAEHAFSYDVGKIINGEDSHPELQRDTPMWSLPPEVQQAVKGFNGWKQVVAQESRPPSLHQQRDWLLNRLLAPDTARVDDIPQRELRKHVPDLLAVLQGLQKGGSDAYLTSDRRLNDPAQIRELPYKVAFPFKDASQPAVYVSPMASGSTVRADNPFKEIRVPVRGTVAVEMEGAAFYRTLQEFGGIQYLLVKGVCDYADRDKDDSYHEYAGRISALYLFAFLREYMTSARFPDIGKQKTFPAPTPTPELEQPSIQGPQNTLNLFYSYAPKDEEMRTKLAQHLVMLKTSRGGPVQELYANKIGVGLSNNAITLLERSQIILLLISADFMASDDLYEQLNKALELQATGQARIIPIRLYPTDLERTPLKEIQTLPKDEATISEARNKDAAFVKVVQEIKQVIEEFQTGKK